MDLDIVSILSPHKLAKCRRINVCEAEFVANANVIQNNNNL